MDEPQGTEAEGGNVGAPETDPDTFTVTLDQFTGPLDLLLFLIKKNQMDIRNLAVAPITDQYRRFIDEMEDLNLEVAGGYQAMASELLQLKSRMILPRPPEVGSDEADPRKTLVDRLLLYRRYQSAGGVLKDRAVEAARRFYRGTVDLSAPYRKGVILLQEATLFSLLAEYRIVLDASRGRRRPPQEIALDSSRVEDRARDILGRLADREELVFDEVFFVAAPRVDLLVLLLSLLELSRLHLIRVRQEAPFGAVRVSTGERYRPGVAPEAQMTSEQIFEVEEEPAHA
ncbi:MAG: hypothetical protein A3G34_07690 [Candidatus Lindowbacteria bacterium RIFCSPLOWO2_12_FULL_62_27]|nr:MAG: hypothetical protein A3G34_07690 [Candidatus Lindowbacteria bacterium RIFCSPLOWO2_12_FULL_62_27]OGH63564.1 MAG: hypothetical protein A3I06_06930 [Candidatus Lindowbacteria bacterium RIFCSPLOWO2_02_FULL_62_12]